MDDTTYRRLSERAGILKALGHPARLFIAEELNKGERCVCELTEMLDIDVSTVSRHLSVMKHAGIVHADKRANKVYYSLNVPCVINFITCVDTVLEQR